MRHPTRKYSINFVAWGFLAMFMLGTLIGVLATRGQIQAVKAQANPSKIRSQVKFLPIPDVMQLKTETVLWIDPGWKVVGIWKDRMVMTREEPEWTRDPSK